MTSGRTLRTAVLATTITTFSLAALLGVVALLSGDFGDTEARILGTTVLVGCASIAVLCFLAVGGTEYAGVGLLGGVVTVGTVVIGLVLIWADVSSDGDLVRAFLIGIILAGTLAQACLLLALAAHGTTTTVRVLLLLTLCAAALLAVLLIAGVFEDNGDLARVIGIVAILDVLGTVVVAALSRFGPAPAAAAAPAPVTVTLPAALAARVDAAAGDRSRSEVVAEALDAWLEGRG